jgi:flagellar biosynthesis protein FlhF
MHVKRYHAPNVQDALRAVRRDLGPDALVLSTRLVAARGPRGWLGGRIVELTAAAHRTAVPEIRPIDEAPAGGPWPDPAARQLAQRLTADEARRTPADARPVESPERRRAAMLSRLRPLAAGDRDHAPIEVFIGAPGSGKTTTVAGIAARNRVRTGAGFALVTASGRPDDTHGELQLHAAVVGASLVAARSPYELQTVLETATVPLLVDIDGRGPAAVDLLRVVAARSDARVHLVLPADAPLETMREVCGRYAAGRPSRAVITRMDLAPSARAVASLLQEQRLLVSYVTVGPRVPEDLLPMTSRLDRLDSVISSQVFSRSRRIGRAECEQADTATWRGGAAVTGFAGLRQSLARSWSRARWNS